MIFLSRSSYEIKHTNIIFLFPDLHDHSCLFEFKRKNTKRMKRSKINVTNECELLRLLTQRSFGTVRWNTKFNLDQNHKV